MSSSSFSLQKVKQTNVNRNYLTIWHLKLDTVSQEQTSPVPECELSCVEHEHRDCAATESGGLAGTDTNSSTTGCLWEDLGICALTNNILLGYFTPDDPSRLSPLCPSFPSLWKHTSCHWSTDSLCWSWQYTLFGVRQLRISPPLLTPQTPEHSRGVWSVVFGLFLFFFCVQPTVRANTAGVMDKKTWLTDCFTGLDGGEEGEEGKYVHYHVDEERNKWHTWDSPILCRQGEARINIGIRKPNQMFLMELCQLRTGNAKMYLNLWTHYCAGIWFVVTHSCIPAEDILGLPTTGKRTPQHFPPSPPVVFKKFLFTVIYFATKSPQKASVASVNLMVIELWGKKTAPSAFTRAPGS